MFGLFNKKHQLPVADIAGKTPGKTLLVTAGVDGDEYAGIAAAFTAAEVYKNGDFSGRLIIVPIVNMHGFDARISKNPLDGKFPKYCIPGTWWGSNSERLMYTVTHRYAKHADIWLDLHSGSLGEVAIPCIWSNITGIQGVDAYGEAFAKTSGAVATVRTQASKALARIGCTYILAESESEEQHGVYIHQAMRTLGMLNDASATSTHTRFFADTADIIAPASGLWQPAMDNASVAKGSVLGTIVDTPALAPKDGIVLWHALEQHVQKGDRLGEMAHNEQKG